MQLARQRQDPRCHGESEAALAARLGIHMVLLSEPERLTLAVCGFVVGRVIHNRKTETPSLIFPLAGTGTDWQTCGMAVAEGVMLDEVALAELEATFRGERRRPGPTGLRRPPQDLERLDRQASGADRPLRRRRGRDHRSQVRARDAGCRSRCGAGDTRFPGLSVADDALGDRPRADEGRARRSREAHRARAGRRAARRARPGDAGVRARGAVRDRHAHRRRRA